MKMFWKKCKHKNTVEIFKNYQNDFYKDVCLDCHKVIYTNMSFGTVTVEVMLPKYHKCICGKKLKLKTIDIITCRCGEMYMINYLSTELKVRRLIPQWKFFNLSPERILKRRM